MNGANPDRAAPALKCLCCGSSDASAPCSFHSGRSEWIYNMGARDDYKVMHAWSCCGKGEATDSLPPPISPGCVTNFNHKYSARVTVFYSFGAEAKAHADKCSANLLQPGIAVSVRPLLFARLGTAKSADCVVFIASRRSAPAVDRLAAKFTQQPNPPWVIVSHVDTDQEASRFHKTSPDLLALAIQQAIRSHAAPGGTSPYKTFLSYRRADLPVAQTVHRFCPCWWDRNVLMPGVDWASDIERGIRDSKLFIVILRGVVPGDSYVWHELRLAVLHKKPIAILAFENEGEQIFPQLGIASGDLINGVIDDWRAPVHVRFSDDPSTSVFYFGGLREQAAWSLTSSDPSEYDTPAAVNMLATLTKFPETAPKIRKI